MSFQTTAESADQWQQHGEFIARHLAMWQGPLNSRPEQAERRELLYRMRAAVDARDPSALDPLMVAYATANLTEGRAT